MKDKLIEQLKEILEVEDREINLEDKFREYEEWDSLAYLSVIAMIDEEFDVVIETVDFKKLLTVDDMLQAIESRMK